MKKILIVCAIVIAGAVVFVFFQANSPDQPDSTDRVVSTTTVDHTDSLPMLPADGPAVTLIAENLSIPWDIAFLPGGDMLITERPGKLTRISPAGERSSIVIPNIRVRGEGGLLGVVLHPDFTSNNWLYLYMGTPYQNGTRNRVIRYRFAENALSDEKVIIDNIPGAIYHDGGRMEFGPDGLLYITTGDATESTLAQNLSSLAGKILRLNDDGTIPASNPFGTAVYSYGHRNPQGLAWDDSGRLWATEHGRSGATSGYDEINLIEMGKNYGWPTIEGPAEKAGMVSPALQSGANETWAPAGLTYVKGKLYFGGLRGETLYEATLADGKISEFKRHLANEYGRIRTTRLGPDGYLYMMTSNTDGRGEPVKGDDRLFKVNISALK